MNFDLKDDAVYQRELQYALLYRKKSFLGRASFVSIYVLFIIIWSLDRWYSVWIINYSKVRSGLFVLLFIVAFFCPIHILIFGRCPKCRKVQPGGYRGAEVGGEGVGLSRGNGFTPFRKRCYFCGTYLSVKQLEKDKLKQQTNAE
ncbi:hypothetical protein [Neisseria zalophi]|uniref:Uncharacterized protein n=1 Tax=Neisseria zalophi TaxID=640030 RepID=A0A5J6PTB4_9NEIS|nr:hypothetical protein [Neisseria zalophi]QEY25968.1 hypothetical protein D0T92_05090 [Neisseria zalophi]